MRELELLGYINGSGYGERYASLKVKYGTPELSGDSEVVGLHWGNLSLNLQLQSGVASMAIFKDDQSVVLEDWICFSGDTWLKEFEFIYKVVNLLKL